MTSGFKVFLILLVVVLILLLSVYSFLKYNTENELNNNTSLSKTINMFEDTENLTLFSLYWLAGFNWFKGETEIIPESEEIIEQKNNKIKIPINNPKKINVYELLKKSFEINNWPIIWNNYWQSHSHWLIAN